MGMGRVRGIGYWQLNHGVITGEMVLLDDLLAAGRLVQALSPGPLDIIGDVHGEIDALRNLIRVLGYDEDGVHPRSRKLVFIGDLTDRGSDSPAVLDLVSGLVHRGMAQCLLGNHELNLLRDARKDGNGWYYEDNHDHSKGIFLDSRPVSPDQREAIRQFLCSLPIALERDDLRLAHAAWHPPSIRIIRASTVGAIDLYETYHERARQLGVDTGLSDRAAHEKNAIGDRLTDQAACVPMLAGLASLEALHQDANPVAIVTSGLERVGVNPFFASGKWRMLDRYPWWDDYREHIPVIMGHYWRWPTTAARDAHSRGEPDLFKAYAPNHWFGANDNVYCVDFAVGARYKERAGGAINRFETRLAAVRWPERQLVMDDGVQLALIERTQR